MSAEHVDMHVPSFGHGLGEALLVEWVAGVGDRVERGDVIAIVETDKASTEIVAERGGRIAEQSAAAGTILKSGDVLYRLTAA
ncbi:lipoyl domain-containing protein [Streptomyces sp. NPDC057623]|uniref:lipoyl domain-containing protein n=1 Tax=Streptomyces sp. NPDC057623 TaxID=3346187 RepID=UPI003675274A